MKGVEFEDKEGVIAVALGGAFETAAFVVDAVEFAAGDRELEATQDAQGLAVKRHHAAQDADDSRLYRP